ncbi:MAG: aspartyl protease family protein [Desulfobacterales bacterium]|nr:MAG: aspartyl protease family protein [Desulfobacterales bacterium]
MFRIKLERYAKPKITLFFFFIVSLTPLASQAGRSYSYFIDRDENGFFIQTENDGSYYLDSGVATHPITSGEEGRYNLVADEEGTYLLTSHHGKFFIDSAQTDKIENEEVVLDPSVSSRKTKIIVNGDQVLVPVKIRSGSKRIEALLLLDTGATMVALHGDLAKKLKIKAQKKAKVKVAGGKTIDAGVGVLRSIEVGPVKKKELPVCIIDSHQSTEAYQGLLGMNFLGNANYRIDFEKQLIIWD